MKIAVITGASSGMGREFALALDRTLDVDEIWLIARRQDRLEALGQTLTHKARPISLDLLDQASLDAYAALLSQHLSLIHISEPTRH